MEILGKGGKTFLKKSFSLPSPNPIPPFPKTFDLIESLPTGLPVTGKARTENRSGVFYGMRREGFYSFRLVSSRIAFTE